MKTTKVFGKLRVNIVATQIHVMRAQHCLYFLPELQGHGSLRPTLAAAVAGRLVGRFRVSDLDDVVGWPCLDMKSLRLAAMRKR